MKKFAILSVLFALALTACQSLGVNTSGGSTDETTKITPSPGQAAMNLEPDQNMPAADEVVVVFQRSGGFAGVNQQWTIYANGNIVTDSGETLSVNPDQVTALLIAADAAGFFDMKVSSSLGSAGNCKDCFTYTLTITNHGQTNTLSAQDGSKNLPDAFWSIIQLINTIINPATQQ
jgi:hypothetical protein